MRVLLLGGTGAMGAHLAKLLAASGVETVVTSRRSRSSEGTLRYVEGSATDMGFLQPLLDEKWDVIVDFMTYRSAVFKERVALLLAATSQYVFLSSARVYAQSQQPLLESSPRLLDASADEEYLATDEYALSKAREENILRNCGSSNWTIIRPYITYSEIRLQLGVLEKEDWLYRALRGRTIVFSSDICTRLTTLTYGLNVAEGIYAILGKDVALGQAFHITAKDSIYWEDVLEIYLEELSNHLGHRPAVMLAGLEAFCQTHRNRDQVRYDRLFDRVFDNTAISGFLDTERFIGAEVGLRECIRSFLRAPVFDSIDWRSEAAKDRLTGERAGLSEIKSLKQKVKYLVYRYFKN